MAIRKRRSPAPAFRQPSPYNPITGQHAPIGTAGVVSRMALMQVIEEDTHQDYIICRGFDPEDGYFYNTLSIAKPYGVRGTYPYVVGQVIAAIKFRTQLGDNPGVAASSVGHPADLDEEIGLLADDDEVYIMWMEAGGSGGAATSDVFQLLSDLDGPSIHAFANPGTFNETTHVYEDEHDGEIDAEWTVIIADPTEQAGSWQGDWAEAEDTGLKMTVNISDHTTATVTGSAAAGNYTAGEVYPENSGFLTYNYDIYYIWFDADNSRWVISEEIGTPGDDYWVLESVESYPNGTFEPEGGATGDAVFAEDGTPGEFALWKLTGRPSDQAEYKGGLLETLSAGGFAAMQVYLNEEYIESPRLLKRLIIYHAGAWRFDEGQPFLVYDWLLSSGQQVLGDPDYPPNIMVSYLSAERRWILTGTQCYIE